MSGRNASTVATEAPRMLAVGDRKVLTVREFCESAGITRRTFDLLRLQGIGPSTVKENGRIYVTRAEAESWVLSWKWTA